MDALLADKDEEISNLLSENRILNGELNQCKSDKDFVWSLWQQLQDQQPDVTEAVSVVMRREKAVNEEKDRKIMEILNSKDSEIRHLKNEIHILRSAKKQLTSNNRNLNTTFQKQISENEELRRELEHQHIIDNIDPIRPVTCATAGLAKCESIQRLLNTERSNTDFMAKMATLESRLSETTVDMQRFESDNCDMRSQLRIMEKARSEKSEQLHFTASERDHLKRDTEKLKKELFSLETKFQELECDLAEKKHCTHRMKDKLDECQADLRKKSELLCQLEQAKHETERISRENEEKHTHLANDLRRKYESTRRDSINLKNDLDCHQRSFAEKQREVSEFQAQVQCEHNRLEDELCNLKGKLHDSENKVQEFLCEKEELICQIRQLEQEFHDRLECREREFKRELGQREECFKRDLCAQEHRLRDDFHREIDCEREKFAHDSQEKDCRHQHILEDKRTQFAKRLHTQEQEFSLKADATEEDYKRNQSCLEQDLQRTLNCKEEEFQRQLSHHHDESRRQLERQKDHFEHKIREEVEASEENINILESRYCTQVKFLEEKAAKLDEDFKKTLKAQERCFENDFKQQEEKFRCEKAELEHNLCRARNRLSEVEAEYKRHSRSCTPPNNSKKNIYCAPPSPPRPQRRRSISPPHESDSPRYPTSPLRLLANSTLYGPPSPLSDHGSCPPPSPPFSPPSPTFYHPVADLLTNCETSSVDHFICASTPRCTPPKKSRGRKTTKRSKSAGRRIRSSSFVLNRSSRSLSPMCRFYSNSFSPNKEISTLRKRVNTLETKIDCMKILLQLKQDEMDQLSCAHDRRMKRLQNLQADFKKMIQHCDSGNDCNKQVRKNNNRCLNDTGGYGVPDGMYNELACLKRKNKLISQEKMALEDDIDRLHVQRASDKATIQQLLLGFKPAKNKHCKTKVRVRSHAQSSNSLCWMPNPSCGYQRERPTVPIYNNRHVTSKLKTLQLRFDNSLRDIDFLQNEKMELQKETGLMRDEIKSLRRDVIDARSKETRLRDECEKLREDVSKCEYEKEELKKENETLQQDVEQARDDNINKRWEIGNLRSDAIKLRGEIKELKREITKYSSSSSNKNNNIRKGEITTTRVNNPRIMRKKPQRYFVSSKRSKSARQHQKFLNKSVMKMKRMFGDNFNAEHQYDSLTSTTTTQQNDTTTQQKSSSDTSSLGQAIVCSARNKVNGDVTLVGDESDEYVDDDDTDDVITSDKTNSTISRSIQTKRPSSSVTFDAKKPPMVNPGMVAALRHRLAALQKQYNNLKSAKISQHDKFIVEKGKNEELTKAVENYQSKLKSCKQNLSRLHREIEIVKKSKQELEAKYEEEKMSKSQRYSDTDYKYIEAKLKTANHDNVKIATELQQQKDETDKKANQISIDNDKISRLERDVAMKRQLIDDLRVKVKNHDEKFEKEQEKTREATIRLRTLEIEIGHKKNNIEALRRQVQVATKEKHDYESMLRQSKTEINRQGEAMEKLKLGKSQAEAGTDQLAEEAKLQLTTLASRSEEAIDKLNSKLERSDRKLREFITMTTVLSGRLLEYASSLRNAIYDVKVQTLKEKSKTGAARKGKEKKMSSNAQRIACQILDISSKDFQDLMAPVHEDSADEEQIERNLRVRIESQESDHTWKEEVEKMTNKNMSPPFAKLLCRLLWQKMDECLQMTREESELTAGKLPNQSK